jgi:hypothetical protein
VDPRGRSWACRSGAVCDGHPVLPLGIPMVLLAGRLFTHAVKFMMPRSLAHPIDELTKTTKKKGRKIRSVSSDAVADTAKKARKVGASSASLLLEAPA